MKLLAVLLLVCLALCIEGGRRHNRNNYRYNNQYSNQEFTSRTAYKSFINKILAPTDNVAAATSGVVIPPRSCVITWQQYEQYVVNNDWIGIYSLDDDFSLFPEVAHNIKITWVLNSTNTYRRVATLWNTITDQCIVADGLFMRDDPTLAITRFISGGAFASQTRRDYFLSCDPSQYVLFYICYVEPINGRCPVSETILLVPEQRAPSATSPTDREGEIMLDDIPWTKIESDFRRCLDHLFVDDSDPQLQWTWKFTECADPEV